MSNNQFTVLIFGITLFVFAALFVVPRLKKLANRTPMISSLIDKFYGLFGEDKRGIVADVVWFANAALFIHIAQIIVHSLLGGHQ